MYVHPATGLCYLANPRTASRSTAHALRSIGFEPVGGHHDHMADDRVRVTFCTVRDVRGVLQSWQRDYQLDTLDETVDRIAGHEFDLGVPWSLAPFAHVADHVLHFDDLPDALNRFLARFGLGPVALEHIR